MSKIAIIYASVHHKNTETLVQAISAKLGIEIFDISNNEKIDLSSYDILGFASGIYMSKLHKNLTNIFKKGYDLPKKVFVIYTSGSGNKKYEKRINKFLTEQGANVIGIFGCKGYDTFGPFKLIGGVSKGHPDQQDIKNAISFVEKVIQNNKTRT